MDIVIIDCTTGIATIRKLSKEEDAILESNRQARIAKLALEEKEEIAAQLTRAKAELEAAKILTTEGITTDKAQANYDAVLVRWNEVKAVK